MDETNILYLENNKFLTGDCLTLPSRICLFLLNSLQCGSTDESFGIKIICVTFELVPKQIPGKLQYAGNLSYAHINSDDCPKAVKAVNLPVLISNKGRMVHCGLASVLRKLVKHIHLWQPSKNFIALLGHHEMCLRSCAEVSLWTKFCEVEMPQLLAHLNNLKGRHNAGESKPLSIPDELLKLEDHFHKPAVIPQITKKKKQIYEQLTNKDSLLGRNKCCETWIDTLNFLQITNFLENEDNYSRLYSKICTELKDPTKTVASDLEVPGLCHDFAEGAEVALTDLVLLPSVCSVFDYFNSQELLQDLITAVPCVTRWCHRLISVSEIALALKNAGISVFDLCGTMTVPSCTKKTTTRENGSLVKQKTKVSTCDAGSVVNKLQVAGLDVNTTIDFLDDTDLDWKSLPPSVHPQEGCLPSKRVSRKCEQLANLSGAVLGVAEAGDVIVDFCAGGGHLGILLAHLLPDCQVLLIENKEESIRRAMDRVQRLDLKNITLYQSNLDYFHGEFDVGTCLHACGIATDLVLHKCLQASASFVICPCCYGAVQKTKDISYPQSRPYQDHLTYEEYLFLAHAADAETSGKQFMIAVDKDRQGLAVERGYAVTLKSLKPLTCSPKNNLLIGKKNK